MKNDISQGNMVNLKDIQYPPPFWSKNELYDSGIKGITTIYGIKFLRLKNKTKCILPFIRKSKFIPSFLIPVSLKMIKDMMNQIAQKKEDHFFHLSLKKSILRFQNDVFVDIKCPLCTHINQRACNDFRFFKLLQA